MSLQFEKADGISCSICGDTGWAPVEDKGVRPCTCKKEVRTELLLQNSRIPERYRRCTFDNFEVLFESLRMPLLQSKLFVEKYPMEAGLLYLGNCGVGKTHLAVAVLQALIRNGVSGLFYDFRDLLKEIQDSYNSSTQSSELSILGPVFDVDVLVLDELGASKPTQWVQETMTHIITKRCNDMKLTIFTSNFLDYPKDGLQEALDREEASELRRKIKKQLIDDNLEDRVGKRLRSRLFEMCKFIVVEGCDYREQIRSKHLRVDARL